jgi:Flavin reductase like domain
VSLGESDLFNIFPIDLDGHIGQHYFAFSLRLAGKAAAQVDKIKKIVLARIDLSSKRLAYQLGKNHMKEMKASFAFDFKRSYSRNYGFLLPSFSTNYIEMEVLQSVDCGIHRIYFCKIVHEESLRSNQPELSLIHRYYAQWRIKKGYLVKGEM